MSELLDDPLADAPVTTEPGDGKPAPMSVSDANQALVNVRLELRRAYELQRLYRGRVQQALADWMRATVRIPTREELTRAYLAGETQLRADIAAGRVQPRPQQQRRLGSAIDSFAYYTKSHGRSAGGGRAFARPLVEGQRVFGPTFHGRDLPPPKAEE
ncbi:MAG: hypothetical protein ABSA90_06935 [Xanthobacteraceae bacterium]